MSHNCSIALLCSFLILPVCGCASIVAASGKDVSGLKTREQVQAKLGSPTSSGADAGAQFDEYFTREKISEQIESEEAGWASFFTLGLFETFYLPYELYRACSHSLVGQRLRFDYNSEGQTTKVTIDGEESVDRTLKVQGHVP